MEKISAVINKAIINESFEAFEALEAKGVDLKKAFSFPMLGAIRGNHVGVNISSSRWKAQY